MVARRRRRGSSSGVLPEGGTSGGLHAPARSGGVSYAMAGRRRARAAHRLLSGCSLRCLRAAGLSRMCSNAIRIHQCDQEPCERAAAALAASTAAGGEQVQASCVLAILFCRPFHTSKAHQVD